MVELGGGPDLAGEAAGVCAAGEALRAYHLEGHDPAELPVASLKDRAHAALAQLLQEYVGVEHQVVGSPRRDPVDLERCQPAAPHQLAGHGAYVAPGKSGQRFLQLTRFQQLVAAHGVEEVGDGRDGHGQTGWGMAYHKTTAGS